MSETQSPRPAAGCQCEGEQAERIYAYLDGTMTVEDIREVVEHMDQCPACNHEHELERVIRSVIKRSCCEAAPETLKSRIKAQIAAQCQR